MFTFNTEIRTQKGTGASRRLRRENKIPAVVYGGSKPPISIILSQDLVNNAEIKGEFYSDAMLLVIDGVDTKVKVQAVQRHPFKPKLTHLDFLRIE